MRFDSSLALHQSQIDLDSSVKQWTRDSRQPRVYFTPRGFHCEHRPPSPPKMRRQNPTVIAPVSILRGLPMPLMTIRQFCASCSCPHDLVSCSSCDTKFCRNRSGEDQTACVTFRSDDEGAQAQFICPPCHLDVRPGQLLKVSTNLRQVTPS